MHRIHRAPRLSGAVAALALCTLLPVRLAAQPAGGEEYELRPGSKLIDECVFCDRAPIEVPLEGRFLLTQLPSFVCCIYSVTELSFEDPEGRYAIAGEGNYATSSIVEVTQQLDLGLSVGGVEGIQLGSGVVPIPVPFPAIEITVTEDGTRDPDHRFTLVLVAAPRVERVDYEVVGGAEGSYLVDSCGDCERPDIQVPLAGSFRLARINEDHSPFGIFTLDFLSLRSEGEPAYDIGGGGILEHGGEVALTQHLSLGVHISGVEGVLLDSGTGPVPEGVVFPELQILLTHQNPTPDHVYTLYLAARPAKTATRNFRRGDFNDDRHADISDAIFLLNWRFVGGPAPGCLESADANADALHDLSDAIYLLQYLFLGGTVPPPPGPSQCGAAQRVIFGCESYASCGA